MLLIDNLDLVHGSGWDPNAPRWLVVVCFQGTLRDLNSLTLVQCAIEVFILDVVAGQLYLILHYSEFSFDVIQLLHVFLVFLLVGLEIHYIAVAGLSVQFLDHLTKFIEIERFGVWDQVKETFYFLVVSLIMIKDGFDVINFYSIIVLIGKNIEFVF